MISEQAKNGVDLIFSRAASANLALNSSDTVEIEPVIGSVSVEPPEKKLVVLTIASYVFRLLTIFHVNEDETTKGYFAIEDTGVEFRDVFLEITNRCCGAMNRELGIHFMHTGMSTPYMLENKCFSFLTELKPSYISQHKIRINDSVVMHATLCMCAYAPIDFRVNSLVGPEETGELEMF